MNIVFWFLIIAALGLIWFLLAPYFKDVGDTILGLFNDAKSEMKDEEKENDVNE